MNSGQNVINVNDIPALMKPIISEHTRQHIQQVYLDQHKYLQDHPYSAENHPAVPEFTQGFLYFLPDEGFENLQQVTYARIFINGKNEVDYEILSDNLAILDMTYENAERITIEFLYTPVPSCILESIFSIFDNVDGFMFCQKHEHSNFHGGFAYAPGNPVHVLSNGVVIIE